MQRMRVWLSVVIVGAGLVTIALKPERAGLVSPWVGVVVAYWFGGKHGDSGSGGATPAASG